MGNKQDDFTYIDDIVNANILAKAIDILAKINGRPSKIKQLGIQKGDMRYTFADISKAKHKLGYEPTVRLEEGLKKEYLWIKDNLSV